MMPAGDISWLFSACRGITPILFKNSQKEDLFRPPLDKRAYPELDGLSIAVVNAMHNSLWSTYTEVTIPIAFEVAAQAPDDLPAVVRRRVRDAMVEHHILERMVHDIRYLLLNADEREQEPEAVYLWDNKVGTVANGINYFEEEGDETS